jgi:hypothetical protein
MNKFKLVVQTDSGKKFDEVYEADETIQEFLQNISIKLEQNTIYIDGVYVFTSKIESFYIEDKNATDKKIRDMTNAFLNS